MAFATPLAHRLPETRTPVLLLTHDAWRALMSYVLSADTEVNGFAYVSQVSEYAFAVSTAADVFITDQTVTTSEAEISGDAFAKAVYHAMVDGRDDELKLQWHSHTQGAAYCSPRDMATIETAYQGSDWFVSVVMNHAGEIFARMDIFKPFRLGCPLSVSLVDTIPDAYVEHARREIDEHVTVKVNRRRSYAGA